MKKIIRMLFVTGGFIFFCLGLIGIAVPLLPTTPFLLLASFCFVKGSERFDRWFKSTSVYKKHLEGFIKNRAMTLKQKIYTIVLADSMILISFLKIDSIHAKIFLVVMVIIQWWYFIFRIKTI